MNGTLKVNVDTPPKEPSWIFRNMAARILFIPVVFLVLFGISTANTYFFELKGNSTVRQVSCDDYSAPATDTKQYNPSVCEHHTITYKSLKEAIGDNIRFDLFVSVVTGILFIWLSHSMTKEWHDYQRNAHSS